MRLTIIVLILASCIAAMDFDEARESGDLMLVYSILLPDGSLGERGIIPVTEFRDGLFVPEGDLSNRYILRDRKFWNMGDLIYSDEHSFSTNDFAMSFTSEWESPGLVISLDDDRQLLVNLIVNVDGITSSVSHTRLKIKEVFDREASDIGSGVRHMNMLRSELSQIAVESHLLPFYRDGNLTVIVTEHPIVQSAGSIFKQDTPDGSIWLGLINSGAIIVQGYTVGNTLRAKIDISLENGIGSDDLLPDVDGYDIPVVSTFSFTRLSYMGGIPISAEDFFDFNVNISRTDIKEIGDPYISDNIRQFSPLPVITERVREILGLDDTGDSDCDGLPDYFEILLSSDPLDAHTEGFAFNDRDAYLKMGLLPPVSSRPHSHPDSLPKPRLYPGDPTPNSFMYRAVRRPANTPLAIKYSNLVWIGETDSAEVIRDRAIKLYIFRRYGEAALIALYESDREQPVLMRFVEEWPEWYGETDSDLDGIPDDLEDRGWLFGGLGFDDYGSHYWDRLNTLATIFPAGYEGVVIGSYIYHDPALDLNCISTNSGMFDTDGDGLDDYFEYLWHSCPLLVHSNWTPGVSDDHARIYEDFTAPRPDWVASFQDLDSDGIPNGAECYFMMEVLGAQLDMDSWSSDWDQYSDVEEWMSWWYKDGSFPFPLDDPLPYVVRNGCHPLIPAYPQIVFEHRKDKIRMPYSSTFAASRGLSGDISLTAEIENTAGAELKFAGGLIPTIAPTLESTLTATAAFSVTRAWQMTSTTTYDYSNTQVLNYFLKKNIGTEPTDLSPSGEDYFSRVMDIYWPGSIRKLFYENLTIGGCDDLPPYMGGDCDWLDERTTIQTTVLSDLVGYESSIGDDSPMPDLDDYEDALFGMDDLAIGISAMLAVAPGAGAAGGLVAVGVALEEGTDVSSSYFDDDIYTDFIDDFEQADRMLVNERGEAYNTGASGIFSPDNPCDWTSVLAAHRNYTTIICTYPGESSLGNVLQESPIDPSGSGEDTLFTFGEFIAEYEGTKMEEFFWSDDAADTLVGIGCFPNVWYGDTVDPEHDPACSTLTSYGKWVIISSIDTIAEPDRSDDFETIGGRKIMNRNMRLAKGDILILYYLKDSDSDSLEDQLEFAYGTNPYNRDTDRDKLGDKYELEMGLDPLNPNSDDSFYDALDGEEWRFLTESEGTRVTVGLASGDSIYPPRSNWDEYLYGSPRNTDAHRDFVPYPYSAGGYRSENDDQYMDYNINGVPDWLEKWFQNPSDQWSGRFIIDWDGMQTIDRPWGYSDHIFECRNVSYFPACTTHLCKRIETGPDSSGALEIIFNDDTEASGIWDNSYVYFKIFNCEIPVTKSMELSYDIMPKNAKGKTVCIDFIFSDGFRSLVVDSFYDIDGWRIHPVFRPREILTIDDWHNVTAPLEEFDGKTIIAILFGYEDDPNDLTGLVHCWIDNLSIRTKNIVLDFAPENDPPDGFKQNNILENVNVLGPEGFGEPLCRERTLPGPYEPYPLSPVADTMLFGPRDSLWEVTGYLNPWVFNDGSDYEYRLAFGIMPESPQYRIDRKTTLGYYIWQDESPFLYWDIPEIDMRVPKVVVDLLISTPDLEDTFYMYEYLEAEGLGLYDQFGSKMLPERRNEMDSDSNLTWRPPCGKFWRYIDLKLPEELNGFFIEDVLIRYAADQPYAGRFRAFVDNIAIFERPSEVYYYPDERRQVFGSQLTDYYDDNGDTIVDWESMNIHNVPLVDLYGDDAKIYLSGLIRYNFIGSSTTVDSLLPPWALRFALDTLDSNRFRCADTASLPPSIFYTQTINIDSLPIATWDDDGSSFGRIWGYMSNVPDVELDSSVFRLSISCMRQEDSDGGHLLVRSDVHDSTLLFNVDTAPVCSPMCVIMMFDGRVVSGNAELGYQLTSGIHWFDDVSGDIWKSYRISAPDAILGDTISGIWLKTTPGTEIEIDDFALRRGIYHSFEEGEDFSHWTDDYMIEYRNVNPSTDFCQRVEWVEGMPEPPEGSRMACSSVDLEGFSPAGYKHILFEYFTGTPDMGEMSFTDQSVLMYRIYHTWEGTPLEYANAVCDIEYVDISTGVSHWLSEHRFPTETGFFTPLECGDPLNRWTDVTIEIPEELEGKYIRKIAVHYENHDVFGRLSPKIFIDELVVTF